MKDKRLWAWKAIDVDFTTWGGFVWPFPGNEASSAENLDPNNHGPCPTREGDGLCLAKTWAGAAARGAATHAVLVVSYLADDVLGYDADKLRVKRCQVYCLWDAHRLLRHRDNISCCLEESHRDYGLVDRLKRTVSLELGCGETVEASVAKV